VTGSLGRRYARALLGLARETGALAAAGEELARAAAAFGTTELQSVVLSPVVAPPARRAIVKEVVERLGLSPAVGNLIRLLADRGRLRHLEDVARAYDALVDRELGRARVDIRSAAPLTGEQRAELERLAGRLTGGKELIVSAEVDPDLIGGVVLDTGGTVYDGSVKTQLARLATSVAGASA
jgi:F-type H+-transporting ATPase subunit delta